MNLTAIAREDLEGMGFGLLSNKIGLELNGKVIPDSYGECIGRYYVDDDVYKSFFKKDHDENNTLYFDMYKNTCKSIQEERHLILTENHEEKEVIDYFVMYDIEESTKNLPTEIENYISRGIYVNGYHKCKYELLFAADGLTSRIVIEYKTNNIPMYDFITSLEDDITDILEDDFDEDNIFYGIIKNSEIMMFDEFGRGNNIEIESAEYLTAMLASVRMLSCEFVEEND